MQQNSRTRQMKAPAGRLRPRQGRKPIKQQGNITPIFIIGGRFDMPFLILVLSLLGIGLIVLFSASHASAYYYEGNSYYYIWRQLAFAIAGVVFMLAASFVNYHFIRHFARFLYLLSLVLMAACYLFDPYQGARRWIYLGFTNFQPSEIAKFALILLYAHLIDKYKDKMGDFKIGTMWFICLYLGIAAILLPQPHLSATILIGIIAVTMMLVGGSRFRYLFFLGMGAFVFGLIVLVVFQDFLAEYFSHVVVRLTYWLDPFSTNDPGSYQTRQSLLAIGSGGLWGVGLGDSRQKHMYLPEVRNDFVFAIACEELGFIGATAIIVLFAMMVWRGYTIAMRARDRFGTMLVVGIITQVGVQAFLNIAVVTNLVPNTGISLPFFSYGGTALLIMMAEIGVVLGVSRQSRYEKE